MNNGQDASIGIDITANMMGIRASQAFDLILYVAKDAGGDTPRNLAGTANGVTFAATGLPLGDFEADGNFVMMNVASDANGSVFADESPGAGAAKVDMNGFQLNAVPEPFSLVGLGLAVVRKRGRA